MKRPDSAFDKEAKRKMQAQVDQVKGLPNPVEMQRLLMGLPDGDARLRYFFELDICMGCGDPQPDDHYCYCQRDD